eukprot:scaffold39787_cov788-Skeletonema_dohrnii-CCMP3373.AAC.1
MNRSARVSSTQPVSISLRSSALLIRSLDSFDLVDDYNTDIHSLPPPQCSRQSRSYPSDGKSSSYTSNIDGKSKM